MKDSTQRNAWVAMLATLAVGAVVLLGGCSDSAADAKPNFVFKKAPSADVVAKINGKDVTMDELVGPEQLTYVDLQKRLYDFKMKRLKDLLVERLVGAKAKEAGMDLDKFIAEKVTKGKIKITQKEFDAFVKERRISKDQITDRLKERINQFLTDEKKTQVVDAYVAKLTKSSPVEVYFTKPRLQKIDIENAPLWGKKTAKVTIVEFSDFQCPFCARAAETVEKVKKKYKGKVALTFKHFPLPMHPEARPASEASMCLNEQSGDKFWKFHNVVFENQRALTDADLEKYAKQVGADMKKFQECYKSKKYADYVQKDLEYGEKLGIRSTPTFFINGQLLSGAVPFEQFQEVIDEELSM